MVDQISRLTRCSFVLALFAFTPLLASAQEEEPEARPAHSIRKWEHEFSDIEVDARIQFGSLPNGLRYAWAHNDKPEERVYVRLHVDVGSFAEAESERGMAHFLEHMAFNGSKNFEAGTLIEWFQNHGMSFGADTNAHTAFSETVYKLDLPDRDPKTLRDGLQVMRDFASELDLADAEIEAEKGVIDGEQRERDSAGFRTFERLLDQLYAGTNYPQRLPIGTKQARDGFSGESVRDFYSRWYRPENMTLVVVGDLRDFSPVELIEEIFGDMSGPQDPVAPEPSLGAPTMEKLFFSIHEDELPGVQVQIAMLRPYVKRMDTLRQRRKVLPREFAHAMLNLRFSEEVKRPDAPFLSAQVDDAGGLEIFEGADLMVMAKPDGWEPAMTAALVELRRALQFGFQEAELNEIRANALRALDEGVEREATAHSSALLNAILSAAEQGGVPSSALTNRNAIREQILSLTVEACLEALRENWSEGQFSILTAGSLDLSDPEKELRRVYEAAMEIEIERGEFLEARAFAYSSDPEQVGEIRQRTEVEDLGLTQIEFANGVRLNIKPTDFKQRQVLLRARLGGGLLSIADEDLAVKAVANAAFLGGGLGEHSADDLRRLTAGRQVGLGMALAEDHLAFSGPTTSEDLLLQFELLAAFLTDPGLRPDGLNVVKAELPLVYEQYAYTLQGPLLFQFVPKVLTGDPRATLLGLSDQPLLPELNDVDMSTVERALGTTLAKGALEVTVVGDVVLEDVIAQAAATIGVLPGERPAPSEPAERPQAQFLPGVTMTRAIETRDEKANVVILFPTTDGADDATRRNLFFLGILVDDRLRLEVRERLGAAYSPYATSQASRNFAGLGTLMIQAAGEPSEVEVLVDACKQAAASLAEEGVSQEEVTRLVEPILNTIRDMRRANPYWLDALDRVQEAPDTLEEARDLIGFYERLDVEALSKLAAEYLVPERASVLVVLPLSAAAAGKSEDQGG